MTNWHALPYELKCIILSYHVESFLRFNVDSYIEGLIKYVRHAILHPNEPPLNMAQHIQHEYDLHTLLTVAPELRQDAIRLIATSLPVLCERGYELSLIHI